LVDKLFYYGYLFLLPDFFQGERKLTKDNFAAQIEVFKVFSSMEFEKKFFVREFFDSYYISNQQITGMKRTFIELVEILKQYHLIESQYKLIVNGELVATKKLIDQVQDFKETKNLSITQIAKISGRARLTISKILKEELNYIPYNRLVKVDSENEKIQF